MGKARIISGGTDGEYKVEIIHEREEIEAEIEDIEIRLADMEEDLEDVEERLELAELEVEEARILLDAIISDWESGDEVQPPDMNQLIAAHNSMRSANGAGSLTGSAALHVAAQNHAGWLRDNNASGHDGANGSRPLQRIAGAGFPIAPDGNGGENVAVGVTNVISVMRAWASSSGHLANIINSGWEYIGVGYARRTDGNHRHFWVVTFGRPATDAAVETGKPLPDIHLMSAEPISIPKAL